MRNPRTPEQTKRIKRMVCGLKESAQSTFNAKYNLALLNLNDIKDIEMISRLLNDAYRRLNILIDEAR